MIFKRKSPKRLYYPTKSNWYRKPRKTKVGTSRKIFTHGIRTHFTRLVKDAFFYVVIGGVFLALLIFLLFSSRFAVNTIDISRDDLHIDSSAVADLLTPFKGKSIFTFSKQDAEELIHKKYPEFATIEISKLLPNTIKINLKTYDIVANIKAFYVLPQAEKPPTPVQDPAIVKVDNALKTAFDLKANTETEHKEDIVPVEQKALLNEIGQAIFDREENLELMTITMDGLTQPVEDRQIVIPKEAMEYILNSIKYLTNIMQMEVSSVHYLPVAREVHLKTNKNLELWLSTDKDYKEQLDKLHTIYKAAELDKEDLAYIDLRIREKIIYCPRHSACNK